MHISRIFIERPVMTALVTLAILMFGIRVSGFSCITCATGLDAMLRQQKGITSSASTYPQGIATIGFDPEQITEKAITAYIASLGFIVEDEHKGLIQPIAVTSN